MESGKCMSTVVAYRVKNMCDLRSQCPNANCGQWDMAYNLLDKCSVSFCANADPRNMLQRSAE